VNMMKKEGGGVMARLSTLLASLSPGHPAWHEAYKFAVLREADGSLWVVDARGSTAYKYPVSNEREVLMVFGEATVKDDGGWILL
jgi:hypothetical protein